VNLATDLTLKLLDYIKQLETLRTKPAYAIPNDPFVLHEHEVFTLPEVRLDLQEEGEEVWLRLPRLAPSNAPALIEPLQPWVVLPRDPSRTPELKGEVLTTPTDGSSKNAAPRKLEDHQEIRSLFEWYVEHHWTPWAGAEIARRQTIATYDKLFKLHQALAGGADQPLELVWGIGHAAWKPAGQAEPERKRYKEHEGYDDETRDVLDDLKGNIDEAQSLMAEYKELRRAHEAKAVRKLQD